MKKENPFQHTSFVILKFVVYFVLITLVFTLFFGKEIGISFGSAVTLAIVSYIGGDLFMLPIMGNMTSTLGDFILNGLAFFMISYLFQLGLPFYSLLLTSFLTCIFEYFFHGYLKEKLNFHMEV